MDVREIYGATRESLEAGEVVALCTVVRTKGPTPQKAGAKLVVRRDGSTIGTIGGGCSEADVKWRAIDVIETREPQLVRVDLTADIAAQEGEICGGIMDVFIEPVSP